MLPKTMYSDRGWLSREQVANYAGVSLRTVIRWEHHGLPRYPVRGRVLYKREEVDQYIDNYRQVLGLRPNIF